MQKVLEIQNYTYAIVESVTILSLLFRKPNGLIYSQEKKRKKKRNEMNQFLCFLNPPDLIRLEKSPEVYLWFQLVQIFSFKQLFLLLQMPVS